MNKWRITYQKPIEYEVVTCPDIFNPSNDALSSVGKRGDTRRFVVVDSNVETHYAAAIREYFKAQKIDAKVVTFPAGEKNKSIDTYLWVLRELDTFPINRRDEPIIAIGGGVLTDVVAFVASSYRRGVPHIKIPTTYMGYIDASVGIKNGINFNNNKNRLGSFEPPKKVFLDRTFLKTLPERHILNGVCETLKLAIIKDVTLFELLESDGAQCVQTRFQDETGASILDCSVGGMLEELEPNLFEDELARKVDFGHTFSYGLETRHETELLHGEAVLIDMVISSILAEARGLLSKAELNRIFDLIVKLNIPLNEHLVDPGLLWTTLEERTYHRNGFQRVPLPAGLGKCTFVNDIKFEEIQSACRNLKIRTEINDTIYQH